MDKKMTDMGYIEPIKKYDLCLYIEITYKNSVKSTNFKKKRR